MKMVGIARAAHCRNDEKMQLAKAGTSNTLAAASAKETRWKTAPGTPPKEVLWPTAPLWKTEGNHES